MHLVQFLKFCGYVKLQLIDIISYGAYCSSLLQALHTDNVNLASINVARNRDPSITQAFSCISLDNNVSTKAMATIKQLPGFTNVAKIQLN